MRKSKALILLISIFMAISSCDDPCDNVDCNSNGVCDDGTCICEDGYEGLSCDAEVNAKFLGDWLSIDYVCTDLEANPTEFIIIKGNSIKEVVLVNADSQDIRLNGNIDDNVINIPSQSIGTAIYQGSMTLNGERLELEIDVELDNGDIFCEGFATRI